MLESANVTNNISFDEKYYPQSVNITYDPHINGPDTRSNSILLPSEPTTTVKQPKKNTDLSLVLNKNESLPPRNANLRTQGSSEDPEKDEYGYLSCLPIFISLVSVLLKEERKSLPLSCN